MNRKITDRNFHNQLIANKVKKQHIPWLQLHCEAYTRVETQNEGVALGCGNMMTILPLYKQ